MSNCIISFACYPSPHNFGSDKLLRLPFSTSMILGERVIAKSINRHSIPYSSQKKSLQISQNQMFDSHHLRSVFSFLSRPLPEGEANERIWTKADWCHNSKVMGGPRGDLRVFASLANLGIRENWCTFQIWFWEIWGKHHNTPSWPFWEIFGKLGGAP